MMGWQGREVKTFLVETWELFYWSLWCPSKLQKRMNQICGEDTQAYGLHILLPNSTDAFRFASQYLLINLILFIPTFIIHTRFPAPINWLFSVGAIMTSYGIGVWFSSMGLGWSASLIVSFIAIQDSGLIIQSYSQGLADLTDFFLGQSFH